jgi:hemerythrin
VSHLYWHRGPDLPTHRISHRNFEGDVKHFKGVAREEGQYRPLKIMAFLNNWLMTHILKEDMAYSSYLTEKGASE